MRGYETRRNAVHINIPCATHVQDGAIGSSQRAIQNVASAMPCRLALNDLIFPCMLNQRLSQPLPVSNSKAEPQKERCLAAASRMRGIE